MPASEHDPSQASDLDARIAECSRLIADNPRDGGAYRERGLLLARRNDDDAALADLDRAIALDAQDAHAFALRGLIREARGDLERALSDLNVAVGLGPDSGALYAPHRDRVLARASAAARREPEAVDRPAAEAPRRQPSLPSSQARGGDGALHNPSQNAAAADDSLAILIAACRDAGQRPHDLETSLLGRGFGPSAVGLAAVVYKAFVPAREAAARGRDPDAPWQVVRGLALDLHHRSSTRAAAVMLDGLFAMAERARPTQGLFEALRADRRALRQHVVYPLLMRASEAERWADALKHIDELLSLETDTDERDRLRAWRGEIAGRLRRSAIRRWSIAIGIAAVVLLVGGVAVYRQLSTPRPAAVVLPSPAPPAARVDVPPAGLEVPPIADLPLTPDNIRYCLFQDIRIQAARAVSATDAQRIRLDAISADLRQRCKEVGFYAVQFSAEVAAQRSRLEAEGRAMVAGWKTTR